MRYRKLCIAWSVVWGVVAVLLGALWVRGYYHNDVVLNVNKGFVQTSLGSTSGVVYLYQIHPRGRSSTVATGSGAVVTIVVPQTFGWKYACHEAANVDSLGVSRFSER